VFVCVCVWDGPLRLQTQRVEVGQEVAVGAVRLHQPQQLGILTAISDLGRRVCMCVYVYVCVCVCVCVWDHPLLDDVRQHAPGRTHTHVHGCIWYLRGWR
jgi:hypothetical protein